MSIFLKAKWENIIMVNYPVSAEILQPFIPKGVELDLYNGTAYVSLVGFLFKDIRIFNIPVPFYRTFEEVNLRFYVVRKNKNETKRGVVFINETVPNQVVAWLANKLYREHYTATPTRHHWERTKNSKKIGYQWQVDKNWNSMAVQATAASDHINEGSFEEFIFEHYFGYTKINESTSEEYKILHPSWKVNKVVRHTIQCDFEKTYGKEFGYLNAIEPHAVFMAEGSSIAVDWRRKRITE